MKLLEVKTLRAWFIVLALSVLPLLAFGQGVAKRAVSLEWEEVPEVTGYEIEITRVLQNGNRKKPIQFKVKGASWSAKVYPGRYEMRMRSIDDRGVAGDWSDPTDLWVKLPPPQLITPEDGAELKTGESDKYDVTFKWQSVPAATGYRLEVLNKDGQVAEAKDVSETSAQLSLPVGAKYGWRVTTLMEGSTIPGEVSANPRSLGLLGQKLATPKPEKPDSKFVTELKWAPPEHATHYAYAIMRKDSDGKWRLVDKQLDAKENVIKLDPNKPGGNYKLQVKAMGDMRETSDVGSMDFYVYEGARTPAAIETAMLREAIDKEHTKFFIASYLLSNQQYEGSNRESGKKVKYDVLGGTGRLGYGYMPKGKWGFVGIADLSGVVINNRNYLYASIEAQAVWRKYVSAVTQFRAFGGLFVRQTPEVKGQDATTISVKDITHVGPSIGAQIWHPLSYKFGMQVNAQGYFSMLGLETPNGRDIVPTMSYQVGAMGSYKIRQNITGLAGYAYRVDNVSYKARPYENGSTELNFASEGDVNEVSLTGHYLNLYLEVGF